MDQSNTSTNLSFLNLTQNATTVNNNVNGTGNTALMNNKLI